MPISRYLERRNDELSGGEMQLSLMLIRSLIFEPKVLLFR